MLRSDGGTGLQITVTTSSNQFEVMDVSPELAAGWCAQLAGFLAETYRARSHAEAEATLERIRRQNQGLS